MTGIRLSAWALVALLCACGASLSPAQVSDLRQRLFQVESIADAEAIFLEYLAPVSAAPLVTAARVA